MAIVLFDCDGVLVNTEQLVARASREVLSGYGLIYSEQEYEDRFLGSSMEQFRMLVCEDWLMRTGVSAPEQMFNEMMPRYLALEKQHLREIAGVRDLIESLVRSNIPFAIGSNSFKANIERKLKAVGLYDFFGDRIIAREDVQNPKPAPDTYLRVMALLGETNSRRCIVLEDSALGVASGRAADMHVMGYSGGSHNESKSRLNLLAAGADFVGKDMAAVALEIFEVIDMIDQGPQWRNAPVRAARLASGPKPG